MDIVSFCGAGNRNRGLLGCLGGISWLTLCFQTTAWGLLGWRADLTTHQWLLALPLLVIQGAFVPALVAIWLGTVGLRRIWARGLVCLVAMLMCFSAIMSCIGSARIPGGLSNLLMLGLPTGWGSAIFSWSVCGGRPEFWWLLLPMVLTIEIARRWLRAGLVIHDDVPGHGFTYSFGFLRAVYVGRELPGQVANRDVSTRELGLRFEQLRATLRAGDAPNPIDRWVYRWFTSRELVLMRSATGKLPSILSRAIIGAGAVLACALVLLIDARDPPLIVMSFMWNAGSAGPLIMLGGTTTWATVASVSSCPVGRRELTHLAIKCAVAMNLLLVPAAVLWGLLLARYVPEPWWVTTEVSLRPLWVLLPLIAITAFNVTSSRSLSWRSLLIVPLLTVPVTALIIALVIVQVTVLCMPLPFKSWTHDWTGVATIGLIALMVIHGISFRLIRRWQDWRYRHLRVDVRKSSQGATPNRWR